MNRKIKTGMLVAGAAGVLLVASACTSSGSSAQDQAQATTNAYQQAAQSAVPYPLTQMESGGWLERTELKEHLLRQNDKNAARWVIMLTQQGQVIAQWPIEGMVFDPNSAMTNSQSVVNCGNSSGACGTTVDAPGDNGTWGPEAGNAAFFTTSGVEVQLPASAIWIESDAPLNITSTPLVTYNINSTPSVNHGGVPAGGH